MTTISTVAVPTRAEVRAALPDDCRRSSLVRSFAWLAFSLVVTGTLVALAAVFLPTSWPWIPVWVLYAVATGTA